MSRKEKSDNKKALPKFLGIVLISGLIGGIVGFASGFFGGTLMPDQLVTKFYQILDTITPYSIWLITGVCFILELRFYLQAKSICQSWDGEDEESIEKAEEKLSWALLFTSVNLIINYFFLGADKILNLNVNEWYYSMFTIIAFVLGLVIVIVMQQKIVDLTKKINPEKKGSVYDMKFAKKWMESCDENEQRQIGQASYKAYQTVVYMSVFIMLILYITASFFDFGILPFLIVTIIWGGSQIVYCYECIRLGRHK